MASKASRSPARHEGVIGVSVLLSVALLVGLLQSIPASAHKRHDRISSRPQDTGPAPTLAPGPGASTMVSASVGKSRLKGNFPRAKMHRPASTHRVAAALLSVSGIADKTVNLYPGVISTLVNDASNAYGVMSGTVVVNDGTNDIAYISTDGAIMKVPLTGANKGQATVFVGSPNTRACVDSTNPTAVRFNQSTAGTGASGWGSIDSDGTYLYLDDEGCGVRKISLATGATTTLAPTVNATQLAIGNDGNLYVAAAFKVLGINTSTGAQWTVFDWSTSHTYSAFAITSDSQYLWLGLFNYNTTGYVNNIILGTRWDGGASVQIAGPPIPNTSQLLGNSQLVSAGRYLYVSSTGTSQGQFYNGDRGVEKIDKGTGAVATLAGSSTQGFADGEFHDAQFSFVSGLASDGKNLWVIDQGNHRLREAQFVPLLAQELGASSGADASTPHVMAGDPVDTNPASGAFTFAVTDATLPSVGPPLAFSRYFSSSSDHKGRFGMGWSDSFDGELVKTDSGANVTLPGGQVLTFTGNDIAGYVHSLGGYDSLAVVGNNYVLTQPDGSKFTFSPAAEVFPRWILTSITDRVGNHIDLAFDSLSRLTSATAKTPDNSAINQMTFDYSVPNQISLKVLVSPGGTIGRTITYSIDPGIGSVTAFTDLSGNTWHYTYTGALLHEVEDPNSTDIINTSYGTDGRVVAQQDGQLPAWQYSYTACGARCTQVTDGRSKVWKYQYTTDPGTGVDVLDQVTDPDDLTTTYHMYDLVTLEPRVITGPRNDVWTYNYDATTGRVLSVASPASGADRTAVYDLSGPYHQLKEYTDGRGNKTTYFYYSGADPNGSPDAALKCVVLPTATSRTSCTADPKHTIQYVEFSNGLVKTVTPPAPDTTSSSGQPTNYTYWPDGVLKTTVAPAPAASGTLTTSYSDHVYDTTCVCTKVTKIIPRGQGCSGSVCNQYTWTYQYDRSERLTQVSDPLGDSTTYQYDSAGRLYRRQEPTPIGKTGTWTTYSYSPGSSRVASVAAPVGNGAVATTYHFYNGNGQLACTVLPTAPSAPQDCSTDPWHTSSVNYTGDGRIASSTDPDNKTWSWDYGTWASQSKVTVNLPGGDSITTTYDKEDRPTSIDYSDSTPDVTLAYAYGSGGSKTTTTTDGLAGSLVSTYDAQDRLTSVQRGSQTPFSYGYASDSHLLSRTLPDPTGASVTTTYTYFPDGSLSQASNGGKNTTFAYNVTATPYATATKTLPNAIVSTSSFDNAGRLVKLKNAKGSTIYSQFDMTGANAIDRDGAPLSVVTTVLNPNGTSSATDTIINAYDDARRLVQTCYTSCTGTNAGWNWAYDNAGNRIQQTKISTTNTTTDYGYDGAGELCWSGFGSTEPPITGACSTAQTPTGYTAYTYNSRGDMTAKGSNSYTYDLADRLKTAGGYTYTYDGLGNRTQASGAKTFNYTWDLNGSVPLLATETETGDSTSPRTYLYAGNELWAQKNGGTRYFYVNDPQGSPSSLTDNAATPAVLTAYWFDPWGNPRSNAWPKLGTGTVPHNPMQFTGQYLDPSGSYNLHAREYDPAVGRFSGRDPAPASGGAYIGSYVYANSTPTVYADPSGASILSALRHGLDWFNEHLNPGYSFLVSCLGLEGTESVGSLAPGCAVNSAGLVAAGFGVVGLARYVAARGATVAASEVVATEAEGGAINTGGVAVYTSTNAAGDVDYVGITNNLTRRGAEQLAEKGISINPVQGLVNLSRADARAVEQVLIEEYGGPSGGQLLNKINSIATSNPSYALSIQRGCEILATVGYGVTSGGC